MNGYNYLPNSKLDRKKWDNCVSNSFNKRVYALSWYLDLVAKNWDAIIYGDYEAVFPVVFKNRIFFKKYYQPFFAQQLGLFILIHFDNEKRKELITQFFDFIYKKIGSYNFCATSEFSDYYNEFILKNNLIYYADIHDLKKKINLELDLSISYNQIKKNYNKNTMRNLEKSIKKDLSIVQNIKTHDFIYLYNNNVARHIDLKAKQINVISKIIDSCIENKTGYLFGVLHKGRIIAGAFFISCFNRDILIFHATEKDFKDYHPITYLIDFYIKNNANKNKILDFEGSNIAGVYRFYSGFAAIENNYLHIKK